MYLTKCCIDGFLLIAIQRSWACMHFKLHEDEKRISFISIQAHCTKTSGIILLLAMDQEDKSPGFFIKVYLTLYWLPDQVSFTGKPMNK